MGNAKERTQRDIHAPSRPNPFAEKHAVELEGRLKNRIAGEVRFDTGSRAMYATDASNYRQTPIGVVIPRSVEDMVETMAACREFGAPILARGGGTSLAGQCCNVAVVMDMSKYMRHVLEIDAYRKTARVQPGLVLDELQDAAAEFGLFFGPDPATHNHCTLGGMIGNNSCGIHSVVAGRTSENVESLEILTYDGLRMKVGATSNEELEAIIREGGRRGEIYSSLRDLRDRHIDEIRHRMPKLPRRSSGFDLDALLPENGFHVARALTGTEGTCVTILEATVRLLDAPKNRAMAVLGFPDVFIAAERVAEVLKHEPIGLEGMDDVLVRYQEMKKLNLKDLPILPPGRGWLLVEFGGDTPEQAKEKAHAMAESLTRGSEWPHARIFNQEELRHRVWKIRESGLGATARVFGAGDFWPGWEDSSVPLEHLAPYLRGLRKLFDRYGYQAALYGHFGQACVHCRVSFDLRTEKGIRRFREFLNDAADLVVGYGGALSGEHGDGQARADLLTKMYGKILVDAFREFKRIWDPGNRMNPGKVVDPDPITSNLRLGAGYRPALVDTHFKYPAEDEGRFEHATSRCVGIGECRRMEEGTMCPSYRVTLEEKHSTRGRAHLLHDMIQGRIPGGFRSQAVKESLDLCLSCKGCLGDCPVRVDVATYKAEFLSKYYEGRLRPPAAYSMGLIPWVARAASLAPHYANMAFRIPVLSGFAKRLGGIAPDREMPRFAQATFRAWFHSSARSRAGMPRRSGKKVLLWPDTFTNFFSPEIGASAVAALEKAGFHVEIPDRILCCGRPLYDFGMLDLAKRQLRQILRSLRPWIAEGVPMVGLEPSCVAVFRDELKNLFPEEDAARRLSSQTYFLNELLQREDIAYKPPPIDGQAILQIHCHQKAIQGEDGYAEFIASTGLDFREPESGCCGMAGSFGFEEEKYAVSMTIAERHLLPAVRSNGGRDPIVADGFSCREQIRAGGGGALHLAQVLHRAEVGEEAFADFRSRIRGELKAMQRRRNYAVLGAAIPLAGIWLGSGKRRKSC